MSQSSMLSHGTPIDSKDKKSLARPALKKPNLKATKTKMADDHITDSSLHPGAKSTITNRLAESQQESVGEPLEDTPSVLIVEADVKEKRVHPMEKNSSPAPIVDTGADTPYTIQGDIFDTEEKQLRLMEAEGSEPSVIAGTTQDNAFTIMEDKRVVWLHRFHI